MHCNLSQNDAGKAYAEETEYEDFLLLLLQALAIQSALFSNLFSRHEQEVHQNRQYFL